MSGGGPGCVDSPLRRQGNLWSRLCVSSCPGSQWTEEPQSGTCLLVTRGVGGSPEGSLLLFYSWDAGGARRLPPYGTVGAQEWGLSHEVPSGPSVSSETRSGGSEVCSEGGSDRTRRSLESSPSSWV